MNGRMEVVVEEIENCQPKVPQSAVSRRPRLTRVPSDRRKRAGPEPSGEKERRYTNKYGNHSEKEEERVRLLEF
jgi:hypothetical protein